MHSGGALEPRDPLLPGEDSVGLDLVPGLDRVILIEVNPDRRVLLMHFIFSIRVNVYSTQVRLFTCLGKLPAEGLPMVLEISDKAFAVQRTVFVVLQFNHVTHLWGIYPLDWQTKPCKRAVKSVGT